MADMRALVTGGSSGIGRETVRLLVNSGAQVVTTARSEDALAALAASLASAPGALRTIPGDLTREEFRAALVAQTCEWLGGLDLLVNAAGIIASATGESTSLADWDHMLDLNLRTVFALTQRCLPPLRASRGAIVNVSSVTGQRAFPGVLAYCVSKAGLDQLTRCLALELAPDGVRVNAVSPGVVRTNLHRASGMSEERYAAFLAHSRETHPLGRVGEPAEVAELIAFLASSRAGWITGEVIAIDGGRQLTCAR